MPEGAVAEMKETDTDLISGNYPVYLAMTFGKRQQKPFGTYPITADIGRAFDDYRSVMGKFCAAFGRHQARRGQKGFSLEHPDGFYQRRIASDETRVRGGIAIYDPTEDKHIARVSVSVRPSFRNGDSTPIGYSVVAHLEYGRPNSHEVDPAISGTLETLCRTLALRRQLKASDGSRHYAVMSDMSLLDHKVIDHFVKKTLFLRHFTT
ncbi:hypothetical protein KY360_02945 [Candidatus Woesearchaeota archaeon]|nr:hypothetical protein [Candidatus Woesearchaeota archaeon]